MIDKEFNKKRRLAIEKGHKEGIKAGAEFCGVKNYEPKVALYGGIDGLEIIEKVINKCNQILKGNGLLAMEIGLGQSFNVCRLLKENGFYIYKITKDYQKIRRCIFAKKVK